MALRDFHQTNLRLPMRVWDLPVRLFHWLIVCCVVVGYVSVSRNWMELHLPPASAFWRCCCSGSSGDFSAARPRGSPRSSAGPIAGLRHLGRFGRRDPDDEIGHNEAGGWMVLAMLLVLFVQVGTGLFPMMMAPPKARSRILFPKTRATGCRRCTPSTSTSLLGLIALHIIAIIATRREEARPDPTDGDRQDAATRRHPSAQDGKPAFAAAILAIAAAFVWVVATRV